MQIQALSSGTGLYGAMGLKDQGSGSSDRTSTTSAAASSGTSVGSSAGTQAPSASQSETSTLEDSYYDVMDTNKDGYVSIIEWLMYILNHPGSEQARAAESATTGTESQASSASGYNGQGVASYSSGTSASSIDIVV